MFVEDGEGAVDLFGRDDGCEFMRERHGPKTPDHIRLERGYLFGGEAVRAADQNMPFARARIQHILNFHGELFGTDGLAGALAVTKPNTRTGRLVFRESGDIAGSKRLEALHIIRHELLPAFGLKSFGPGRAFHPGQTNADLHASGSDSGSGASVASLGEPAASPPGSSSGWRASGAVLGSTGKDCGRSKRGSSLTL